VRECGKTNLYGSELICSLLLTFLLIFISFETIRIEAQWAGVQNRRNMPVSEKGALFYLIGGLILFSTSFKERAFLFFFNRLFTSWARMVPLRIAPPYRSTVQPRRSIGAMRFDHQTHSQMLSARGSNYKACAGPMPARSSNRPRQAILYREASEGFIKNTIGVKYQIITDDRFLPRYLWVKD
jgi:hypothetical protein